MTPAIRYTEVLAPASQTVVAPPMQGNQKQWVTLLEASAEKSAWRLVEVGCELYPCELEFTWSSSQGQTTTAKLSLGGKGAVRVCLNCATLTIRVASLISVLWAAGPDGPVATNTQRLWVNTFNGYAETRNCYEEVLPADGAAAVMAIFPPFARTVRVELSLTGHEDTVLELCNADGTRVHQSKVGDMPPEGLWIGAAAFLSITPSAAMKVRVISILSL